MFSESLFASAANTEIWIGLEFRRPIYREAQVANSLYRHTFAGDLAAPGFTKVVLWKFKGERIVRGVWAWEKGP
jgi:hypothetical protein